MKWSSQNQIRSLWTHVAHDFFLDFFFKKPIASLENLNWTPTQPVLNSQHKQSK